MEEFLSLLYEANKSLKRADHLIYITYPLVREIKLLLVIVENLYSVLVKSIEAVLEYDQLYKRIPLLPRDLGTRIEIFKTKSAKRYDIKEDCLRLMSELKEIIAYHKESPIEFRRKDKYVICLNDYRIKTIDFKKVKEMLIETKIFMEKINSIFENDRKI